MLFGDLRRQKLATITAIQKQIEDLQELLSQEQAHLQAIGSVEQSAESALTQVGNAIRGIRAICPSELETFKAQLLALFDGDFLPPGDPIDNPPAPTTPIDNPPDTPIEAPATPETTIEAPATTIDTPPDTTIDVPLPTPIEAPTPKRRGRKPKAPPLAA